MSETDISLRRQQSMSAIDLAEMGGRQTAWFLRHRHPRHTAKEVVRDFQHAGHSVDERTAKAWTQGAMPINRHLMALIQIYGRPFLDAISAPALMPAEERAIDDRLQRIEDELRRIRSDLASPAHPPRPADDRPVRLAGRGQHPQGPALAAKIPEADGRRCAGGAR